MDRSTTIGKGPRSRIDCKATTSDTERHCKETYAQASKVTKLAAAEFIADLNPSPVQAAIQQLREDGLGLKTCNHYLRAIKTFSRWMYRDRRIRQDVLEPLESFNADTDPRYVRRDMSAEEIEWLLAVTGGRTHPHNNLSGPDRAMAYRITLGTGLRAKELRSLTPESFELDADTPVVAIQAAHSKRRRKDTQPLPPELAELLRPWLANRPAQKPLFTALPLNTARMLRSDLTAARKAWIEASRSRQERQRREESDFLQYENQRGEVLDFHATRHTFISAIVSGGASVKVAQELARHSTPALTIGRYAHTRMHDKGAGISAEACVSESMSWRPIQSDRNFWRAIGRAAPGAAHRTRKPANGCRWVREQ
jgi:integrase